MAEQCRKRRACRLYSRTEVLQALLSDSSDYDDSDADPDYCLPKKSKEPSTSTAPGPGQSSTISAALGEPSTTTAPGPGQSSTISAALGEPSTTTAPGPGQSSTISAALGEPSTTPGPGQSSTISAALGEPSTTTAPGPGQSSTISAALGEPSTTPGPGQSSTISAALGEPSTTTAPGPGQSSTISATLGEPSTTCAANGEPSIPTAILRPSTSGTPCTPLTPERTGLPSTAAARETAVLITSTQTLGEKRQYSDTRKRQRHPEKWKKNIRKEEYNHGLEHVNTAGKKVPKRSPNAIDCFKCRFKCTLKFDDHSRQIICNTYWSLNYNRKKDFILSHLESEDVKRERARGNRKRTKTRSNRFYLRGENEVKIQVCKSFFSKTLCISHDPVLSAIKNKNEHGIFLGSDRRGKHVPHNKTKEEHVEAVKSHIKSFPTMESHYTRASSKRLYLDPNLTIKKMHELFCEKFTDENPGVKPPSEHTYRQIFCSEFNLSFFVPKKDQCMTCTKFANLTGDAKVSFQEDFDEHLRRKTLSHQKKDEDKTRANNDPSFMSVTFDLQSMLQIPSCQASLTYYMRKLCVYNLTVYEQRKPSNAYCYTWQETEGKRGAVEIGTCIYEYLKSLPNTIKEVSLWSDTCSGQNCNQYIATMFLFALKSLPHLSKITHNYLESGHSSMEVDSMHSSIESEKKNRMVFSMIDWVSIFRNARRGRPYIVKQFKHNEFLNFQLLAKSELKNRTKDTNGSRVNWLKVKRFQYRQEDLTCIYYSYDYSGPLERLDIRGALRRRSSVDGETIWELQSAYKHSLPISKEKKADLLKLCKVMVIPDELHGWFNNLPTSIQTKDTVPEPAVSDSEDDDE